MKGAEALAQNIGKFACSASNATRNLQENKMIHYKEEKVYLLFCYALEVCLLPQNRSDIFEVPPKFLAKRKSLKQIFNLQISNSCIM